MRVTPTCCASANRNRTAARRAQRQGASRATSGAAFISPCTRRAAAAGSSAPSCTATPATSNAQSSRDISLVMKTKLRVGFGRFLTGESIFVNEFTAENVPGEIGIAPAAPGDLAHVYLRGNDVIYLQNSAFVACDTRVELATKWQGLMKGFFSGESLFLIRASGEGLVCRFSGKGKVWIQTRTSQAFVSWAHWFRPVKSNG